MVSHLCLFPCFCVGDRLLLLSVLPQFFLLVYFLPITMQVYSASFFSKWRVRFNFLFPRCTNCASCPSCNQNLGDMLRPLKLFRITQSNPPSLAAAEKSGDSFIFMCNWCSWSSESIGLTAASPQQLGRTTFLDRSLKASRVLSLKFPLILCRFSL